MNALVLLTWALLASEPELKDVYTWVDEDGLTHYTNTPDEIPARYRRTKRGVKGGDLGEITTAGGVPSEEWGARPATTSTPPRRAEPQLDEREWRRRFQAARAEIENLKRRIRATEDEIGRLSVGRVMDSGGFLVTNPELEPAKERLRSLEEELDRSGDALRRLHIEAGEQGVPRSWR